MAEVSPDLEPLYAHTLDCVHCGLCLPVCPTYRETGREPSSPRGRIYLSRGVVEGKIPLSETVREELSACLGCRACESACPSGVRFGSLLDEARHAAEASRKGWAQRWTRRMLRDVLPHRRRLHGLVSLMAWSQRLHLDRLARPLLPPRLRELHEMLPEIPPRAERRTLPRTTPAVGERRGRVAFFVGCIMPELFGAVNSATVRVLSRNGFEVVVPAGQGCCGALHAHAGDRDEAHGLMRRNLEAFGADRFDALVVNSAGCGAALREAGEWLPGLGELLARQVRDVSEFLDQQGLRPPDGRIDARVCYDDPCHLVHAQGVKGAPRRLLSAIPGIELVPHDDPEGCCGAAGIYNLTHPEMSRAVLDRKMQALCAVAPDVIASGNPGCLLQLRQGAARAGLAARVLHPMELLDQAYL